MPFTVSKQQLLFEVDSVTLTTFPSQEVEVQHRWQFPVVEEQSQLQQWIGETIVSSVIIIHMLQPTLS